MANTRGGDPSPQKACNLRSVILVAVLCANSSFGLPRDAAAQGVSTAIVRGTVRTGEGASVDGARVRVLPTESAFQLQLAVRYRF